MNRILILLSISLILPLSAFAATYSCTHVKGDLHEMNPATITTSDDFKSVTSMARQGDSGSRLSPPMALNQKTSLGTQTLCTETNSDPKAHHLICNRHETVAVIMTVKPLKDRAGLQVTLEEHGPKTTNSVVSNCL